MLDLDAIEARAEAATEGPWYEDDVTFGTGTLVIARFDDTVVQSSLPLSHTRTAPNADFIAHARTDIPALVAELRAAREVVKAAQTALKAITDYEPEYEFPTPEEEADEEACQDCAAWRAKKHPIQYQCERHVHQKYRYEDRNKAIQAGQHWEMKRIAVAALAALAAYRAVVGEA